MGLLTEADTVVNDLDDAVLQYIAKNPYASFVGISRFCASIGVNPRGPWAMTALHETIVLWPQLSNALYGSLKRLYNTQRIFMHPASPLTYLVDGEVPNMRLIGNTVPAHDRWAPVVFCTFPAAHARKANA